MSENILEKIIKNKTEKIEKLKKTITSESLNDLIKTNSTFVNFKEKIENNVKENKFSIIAEIKKASPSAGIIIKEYDPVEIASKYNTRLIRSSVGEINVVNLMQKECALIGGEGNSGVILTESHLGRDSLVGAAIILNLISNESLSINEQFNLLPKFYIEKST